MTLSKWTSTLAVTLGLSVGLAAPSFAEKAPDVIRIGYALAKSGPNAPGADTTVRPNYEMWVKEVNDAGGLMLSAYGKRVPIEVIQYDDRSSTEEAVRAVERLITQDKVDLVLPPWGTATNLAVAPLFMKHGYPQISGTNLTDKADQFAKRWPTQFFLLGNATAYAETLMQVLDAARKDGKINDKIAMISVADGFGVDNSAAARKAAKEHGFNLVIDKTYPVGTADLSSLLNEVKSSGADTFVAWSYPPDTVLITDQARVTGLNPKVFYTGVGTQFPFFLGKYGAEAIEGQMSLGGIDGNSKLVKDYRARHKEITGRDADYWGSQANYAGLQMLQQAIERVGKIDREAITKELQSGTFDTVVGPVKLENNQLKGLFLVGQWQNGVFQGIGPKDHEGAQPAIIPKPAWK
ncbi:MAG TPA: amino acid ABC transporter substrate-binding protein [Pusillimonas sp.]|uniref:amino acid ABC transporter substrate-binding protein n=1 Tax=Pusillimonas sp. TaxID=3040095 RepID=UPI002CA5E7BC|nr:amino acid ABC transporter substrate-binding protein [Pusillimonas sp.]HUH88593.1 amino acid ABC transporter substrate-binding protein [Pusillimonas sp.]